MKLFKKTEILIESTRTTPELSTDYKKNILKLTGRSITENSQSFYGDVYVKISEILDKFVFVIDIEYINSSSFKYLLGLIRNTPNISKLEWVYEQDDSDILDKGIMLREIVIREKPNMDIELIEKY